LRERLGKDGSFEIRFLDVGVFGLAFDLDGAVGWGSAEGTVELSAPALTDDGSDAQCGTSGAVDWTADRVGAQPARSLALPEDVTMVKIDQDGDVRMIEP
jgi:hypothetical protein